jgi:hypothetical protein
LTKHASGLIESRKRAQILKEMKMGFIATKPESQYKPVPPGNHTARCCMLIDLGTQRKEYLGEFKGEQRKMRVVWEILGEDKNTDGKPFTISKSYFLSMNEKAALRKDLESWRGRAFTVEEEAMFDASKILGQHCMLNVIAETGKDGNAYSNVSSIAPFPKGLQAPTASIEPKLFDLDDFNAEMFEGFSEKTKDIIKASREYKAKFGSSAEPQSFDDDITF